MTQTAKTRTAISVFFVLIAFKLLMWLFVMPPQQGAAGIMPAFKYPMPAVVLAVAFINAVKFPRFSSASGFAIGLLECADALSAGLRCFPMAYTAIHLWLSGGSANYLFSVLPAAAVVFFTAMRIFFIWWLYKGVQKAFIKGLSE